MGIDIACYRASIGYFFLKAYGRCLYKRQLFYCPILLLLLIILLSTSVLVSYVYLCIILSGDVQLNPGPNNCSNLRFCSINCRSILSNENKIDHLMSMAVAEEFDVIAPTETWLTSINLDVTLLMPGFNLIRMDREGHAGGVAFYLRENIVFSRLKQLETNTYEIMWIKITLRSGSYVIGVCYLPQTVSENSIESTNLINHLSRCVDHFSTMSLRGVLLLGDFNAKDQRWSFTTYNNALGPRLYNFVSENNLFQLVNEATRVTTNSESMLDLIITDSPNLVNFQGTLPPLPGCDHRIITGSLLTNFKRNTTYYRDIPDTKDVNWQFINQSLSDTDWDACLNQNISAETALENWLRLFYNKLWTLIPIKRLKVKSRDKPWINHGIKHAVSKKHRL